MTSEESTKEEKEKWNTTIEQSLEEQHSFNATIEREALYLWVQTLSNLVKSGKSIKSATLDANVALKAFRETFPPK